MKARQFIDGCLFVILEKVPLVENIIVEKHEAVGKIFNEKLKFIKMHVKEDLLLRLNRYLPLLMVVHSESESAKNHWHD